MPLEAEIATWFSKKLKDLEKKYAYMDYGEMISLQQLWKRSLDDGAIRAMYYYLQDLSPAAFEYICFRYYIWYYNEKLKTWTHRNASAAIVHILRYTYWEDDGFMREFVTE